ncbi:MAG: hypothetical protein HWD58_04150 [Bacteroidota bacterium]|nr:MAG: hypothetical protein HWD58_04150 [Bacteroidota bacterium]
MSDTKAQDEAIQMTSLVNEARSVLLHPDRCLEYLLRRQGILNEEIKQELPRIFNADDGFQRRVDGCKT